VRFPLFPIPYSLFPAFCLLLAAACFLPTGRRIFAAMGLYEVQEVKPKVLVWIPDDVIDQESDPQFIRAATAGFLLTTDGVVVVDTTNSPFHARELLYEIRERTSMPIKYVINTSAAGDHVLGNEVFTDQQATLISTTAAQKEMEQYRQRLFDRLQAEDGWRLQARMRGFHVTPATQTFDGEMTLQVGDQFIKIASLLCDENSSQEAVVYVPSAKTLFLGEFYDKHYFPRMGSRDVRRWIEVLRQVEGWDVDTYIPGHGAPGSKRDLADFRKFLEWLVAQVEMRIKKGKSASEIEKELALTRLYAWHAPELAVEDVDAVCRQLGAPQPSSTPTPPSQP
jgi:glyoxylase-like metal-dependent hydrolase (beta-lactamase superfamily II)